ncbi:MAG: outer membrane beta-barrel protein [Bacteroidaceae bacterium]|nr:outer membrane beta-barrel protein [Bacteroidaceae bacterium]
MKKVFITALLAVLCSAGANAQHYRDSKYYNPSTGRLDYSQHRIGFIRSNGIRGYVGLRVGPAFSMVNSDDVYLDGGRMRTGVNVGVVGGIPLSFRVPLYFETGLMYTQKGGIKNLSVTGDRMTYSMNYLEFPITLKYICNVSRLFSIQPYAGGFLACGVGGTIKNFGQREAYSSFGTETAAYPNFRRFDGGLKIGCGFGIDMFYADISYDFGLANVSHDYFADSKTGSLQLNVGVNF